MALTPAQKQQAYRDRKKGLLGPVEVEDFKPCTPQEAGLELDPLAESEPLPSASAALDRLLDSVFVDWLSIYQVHLPGSVPIVGAEFIVSSSIETGEIVSRRVTGFQHEGSYDTRLHVRCDGNSVMVSGNPSAYDRMDNLFGVRSVVDAVEVYNRVLRLLGLPEFDNQRAHEEGPIASKLDFVRYAEPVVKVVNGRKHSFFGFFDEDLGRQSAHYESLLADGRPRITAIHLTVNIATCDAEGFLRHISTYVYQGKPGFLYPNGKSVDWPIAKGLNNRYSRRVYHKYYDKAFELLGKLKKAMALRDKDPLNESLARLVGHLQKLYLWALSHGIVRREVELKSTELIARGLIYIESWSHKVMSDVIRPYQFQAKLNLTETRLDNVLQYFLDMGYSHAVAAKCDFLHTAWLSGHDVHARAGSPATFRRYRVLLLGIGVDIQQKCNVSRISYRANRTTWAPIDPPDWYDQPAVSGGN